MGAPASVVSRRQSIHFPHRARDQLLRDAANYPALPASALLAQDSPVSSRLQSINAAADSLPTFAQGHVLTLPFGDDKTLLPGSTAAGQLTLSQVRCTRWRVCACARVPLTPPPRCLQDRCLISIAGFDVPVNDATWSVNTDSSNSGDA